MGGSSKSKTSEVKTTNVTTTTSTKMGDVGLTGAQMVDMAAVLETGGIERERIASDTINNLVQATGNAWTRLIGGASDMVETSAEISEYVVDRVPILLQPATELAELYLTSSQEMGEGILKSTQSASESILKSTPIADDMSTIGDRRIDINAYIPLVGLGLILFFGINFMRGVR